ncbi:MAG TPA: DnaJ domain-containing protein [Thermoanaerobaculia bacterium]|nr:DnaJ domain-containing protein [Thermoanaerobaculia bacterium]
MPTVLRHMYRHNHSGELVVRQSDFLCKIIINHGNIVNVQSDNPQHMFGHYLVSKGVLTRATLERLLPKTEKGRPLGFLVEREKDIPREKIRQALIDLHAQILSMTLLLVEGAYSLLEMEQQEIGQPLTSNANLIFHAGRHLNDTERMLVLLGGEDLYLVFSRDPLLLFQELLLYPEEFFYISRLQDFTRVGDYLRLFPDKRDLIVRMLFGLVACGVLELVRKDEALEEQYRREEFGRDALDVLNLQKEHDEGSEGEYLEEVSRILERVRTGDFYRILDLPRMATQREVRDKFLDLAKRFHPDNASRGGSQDLKHNLVTITTSIRDAYETLSRTDRKRIYDNTFGKSSKTISAMSNQRQLQLQIAQQNYEKAQEYLSHGENYIAYQMLDQAFRFDPRNRDYLLGLVRLEIQNPRWHHRAVQKLSEYLETHPEDGEVLEMLGDIFMEKGMKTKAREMYQQALKLFQGNKTLERKVKETMK